MRQVLSLAPHEHSKLHTDEPMVDVIYLIVSQKDASTVVGNITGQMSLFRTLPIEPGLYHGVRSNNLSSSWSRTQSARRAKVSPLIACCLQQAMEPPVTWRLHGTNLGRKFLQISLLGMLRCPLPPKLISGMTWDPKHPKRTPRPVLTTYYQQKTNNWMSCWTMSGTQHLIQSAVFQLRPTAIAPDYHHPKSHISQARKY